MSRLPAVRFERGLRLTLPDPRYPNSGRSVVVYCLIGRLETGQVFFLEYEGGIVRWECPVHLGEPMRRKILHLLRTDIRTAETAPSFLVCLDYTQDPNGIEASEPVRQDFFQRQWRRETLGEQGDDFVDLKVPFEEKNQVKALGARWDPTRRVWQARRQKDMSAFARWLPSA